MAIKHYILFFLLLTSPSHAAYFGIGYGHGDSTAPLNDLGRVYVNGWRDAGDSTHQIFMGFNRGHWSIETGLLHLPTYRAYAEGVDPHRSTTQVIKADSVYLRAKLAINKFYVFYGPAWTRGKNHEFGLRENMPVEHKNSTRLFSHYYGVGANLPITRRTSIYAEYGVLPEAVKSYWTNDRTYRLGTVGISWSY